MAKIITVLTLILTALCSSVMASSTSLEIDNSKTAQSVYIYPDFNESVYANILTGPTCDTSSLYSQCAISSKSKQTFTVHQYNGSSATIVCLSKTMPGGKFNDCAPTDCEAQVNFVAGQPVATKMNGNCKGYTFPNIDAADKQSTENIISVN